MIWTDDPLADFFRCEAEQQKELNRLPKCDWCGEPIQDEHFYLIKGDKICLDCLCDCKYYTDEYIVEV